MPVLSDYVATAIMWPRQEDRKVCETRAEGCYSKWQSHCRWNPALPFVSSAPFQQSQPNSIAYTITAIFENNCCDNISDFKQVLHGHFLNTCFAKINIINNYTFRVYATGSALLHCWKHRLNWRCRTVCGTISDCSWIPGRSHKRRPRSYDFILGSKKEPQGVK